MKRYKSPLSPQSIINPFDVIGVRTREPTFPPGQLALIDEGGPGQLTLRNIAHFLPPMAHISTQ